MELINIDKEMCKRDGICIQACPLGCIKEDAEGYPVTAEGAECIQCGQCVAICPHGALVNGLLPIENFIPMPRERAEYTALSGLMKARRSVRIFKDQPVDRDVLAELVHTAHYAPTAKNTQQVSFIVTADAEKTHALGRAIGEWMATLPGMERYARLHKLGLEFALRGAPHLVVALCDTGSDWALTDAAIALSYMELAAAAHGLGVCWGGIPHRALAANAELASMIGVPEGRKVSGALMLGIPKFRYSLVPPRTPAQTVWI